MRLSPVGNHGNYVCQIGNTKYKTLEEALQVVTSGKTIIMIANYTMTTPGDYILPSGAKLLVPYSGQTATKETDLEVVEGTATPSLNLKLTFAEGVHLVSQGVIEAGAKQTGQGSSELTGQVYGSYGQIQLSEGSSITLESGATLYAWGYVTGKGEIIAKSGSKSYEMFQLGWYKGGNTTSEIYSNRNNYKIFPMTDYAYQNIECPITYYAGAFGYGRMAVKPYSYSAMQKPTAELVGTNTNSFFRMPAADASANTWVRKEYDLETDYTNWIMNSGATLSGISMNVGVSVNSADYYLPITSNFRIVLNYGELYIGNDVIFLPGSQLIVNKEATGIIASGKYVFFYDAEDWFTGLGHESVTAPGWSKAKTSGYYYYPATYSPSWRTPTSSPRKNVYARDKASIDKGVTPLPDAELFVHGKLIVNGSLYTSGDGNGSSIGRNANIHSTNEDAGKIIFKTQAPAATATKPLYKVCYMIGASEANNSWSDMIYGGQTTAYPALLQNGDGSYTQSAKTEAEKSWVYYEDKWQCWTPDGCFIRDAQNKPYANPAGYVQLTSDQPDENHLHHDAETGSRNFVWDENCYWWEVVSEPTAEGYYCSINADHNGDYNYYYYDSAASCWKIKKITVTWNVNGTNTDYSVGYGTKPEWLGATPTKSSSSDDYVWRWDGWTMGSDATVLANSDLPYVTENTTFTAHFYEKYYEYNITFKNSDGTILESKNWIAGTTPSYEGTPTKNATVDYTYEFNGSWSPAITTVTGSATYTAQYTAIPRKYTITFLNYDMSVLGTTEVVYNGTPSNATYLAAVAPMTEDPYKPDNSAFSFEFAGWRLQGASSNGFAQVKGNQTYVAQFNQTTKKYKVSFVDDDGETVLHYLQLEYGQTPSYTWADPSKQDAEWTYSFTGWTPATFSEVQGPQTYVANYNKTKRKYTITWLNDDNSQIDQTQVAYGEVPTHADATKNPTAEWTYTFTGWDNTPVEVSGDATYKATFSSSKNSYEITWLNYDNSLINKTMVEYGVVPTHADAAKASDAQYDYIFTGWNPAIVPVTANATYTATFNDHTIRSYQIRWENKDGSEIQTDVLDYGKQLSYSTVPCSEVPTYSDGTGQLYLFRAWKRQSTEEEYTNEDVRNEYVEGAETYTAQYDVINKLDVASEQTISVDAIVEVTTVHVSGRLNIAPAATLTTDDLILEGTTASSGEITGTVSATRAFYDLSNEGGFEAGKWYSFAVPWQVDATNGSHGIQLKNGETFSDPILDKTMHITYYNGENRGKYGKGNNDWYYVADDADKTLIPGRLYMIYLTTSTPAIRFTRIAEAPLDNNAENVHLYAEKTGRDGLDANWNGIANPKTYHAYLNAGVTSGQAFDANTQQYIEFILNENKLFVGQPVFVQASTESSVVANADNYNPAPAQRRNINPVLREDYEVHISANGQTNDHVRLYVDEDKEADRYTIGQDLAKMGVSNRVPQMWVNRYNTQLCVNTIAPVSGTAEYPLGIFTPAAGEYNISVMDAENHEANVYLTYNGYAIWNLSNGAYTAWLPKGNIMQYGLRLTRKQPGTVTNIDEPTAGNNEKDIRKVVMDDHVYIIRDGIVYSIDGQLVK